jgi:hypothetical protein
MEKRYTDTDQQGADATADRTGSARRMAAPGLTGDRAAMVSVDASDGIDEQSEQSFPASDPPSWSGLSL